nr:uncharacterized protein LOC109169324 [Ipomoea batatas]
MVILDFIKAKFIPNSHRGNVRRDQVLLTYYIKEQETIDIGKLISQSICENCTSRGKVALLSWPPVPHHRALQACWSQVPIPDPEDAEDENQGEDESTGDPQPEPAQNPPQVYMHEFMRRGDGNIPEFYRSQFPRPPPEGDHH